MEVGINLGKDALLLILHVGAKGSFCYRYQHVSDLRRRDLHEFHKSEARIST